MSAISVDDLPDEVLEFILSLVPPYQDIHDCMLVSKRWRRCVINVAKTKKRNLHKSVGDFDVRWESLKPVDMTPTISKRYSHTCAVHENSMYVFGGCTSTSAKTTFNDLWRLDLSTRQWMRPITMGTYPSPKACSSLVSYKDTLVLFGGWTYPPSYPLHQSWNFFNELHMYDIRANRWTAINTLNSPPPIAGHSVSVIGEWMIIFGGLRKPSSAVQFEKSNEVWKLNLETWTWHQQRIEGGPKPNGRFGQTQVILDDTNIFIIGGSGGSKTTFSDAWILNMSKEVWKWMPVEIRGKDHKPTNIWSHPGCKVGDKILVLNRVTESELFKVSYVPRSIWLARNQEEASSARIDLANRHNDIDENVNGKRGFLRNLKRSADENPPGPSANNTERDNFIHNLRASSTIGLSAFNSPDYSKLLKSERIKEKRLKNLEKFRENLGQHQEPSKEPKTNQHYLGMYVLDLAHALDEQPYVTWLTPKNMSSGPDETILYTLVEGKSELIMFGGIEIDAGRNVNACSEESSQNSLISNSLHFITAPDYVI